jgi:hypothetical protein
METRFYVRLRRVSSHDVRPFEAVAMQAATQPGRQTAHLHEWGHIVPKFLGELTLINHETKKQKKTGCFYVLFLHGGCSNDVGLLRCYP